jgi:hypothetical protein
MPKNKVSDPITDQEMAFALLVLSGTMTDRCAAEAVGLNPDSAAYTKSKPHVRAYMHEHRAAVEEKLVQQEADKLHRLNLDREQVLARLWEIANMSPEMTRGSITGQVKAISMIVAMQNFIPDRKAVSEKKSPTPPTHSQIYPSAWLGRPGVGQTGQQATTTEPPPSPAPPVPTAPASRGASRGAEEAPPAAGHSQSTFANCVIPSEVPELHVPLFASLPGMRVPFSIKKTPFNPFVRPR